jgi:prefoldin subunit 5
MAATATELLAEDIGSLRESDRQITESIKGLSGDVNQLRADFASFKGSINKELWYVRWIGGSLAALVLPSLMGLAWQAGALSTEVRVNAVHVKERFEQFEKNVGQRFDQFEKNVGQRFDQFEKRMEKSEARIDKLEAKLEARIDKLEAKLDQRFDAIMQRLEQVVPKK